NSAPSRSEGMVMLRLSQVFKDYNETGSLSEQINLCGFIGPHRSASFATRFPPLAAPRDISGNTVTGAEEHAMIADALLFTIVILLGDGFWLLDQFKFLARYKAVLYHAYGTTILVFPAV